MSRDTQPIKCARCKVAVETVTKPNCESIVTCPRCGLSDKLKNVEREVADFAAEHVAQQLDAAFKGIARRNKALTYTAGSRTKRRYRFIVDL
jgi:hypothetical protein